MNSIGRVLELIAVAQGLQVASASNYERELEALRSKCSGETGDTRNQRREPLACAAPVSPALLVQTHTADDVRSTRRLHADRDVPQ